MFIFHMMITLALSVLCLSNSASACKTSKFSCPNHCRENLRKLRRLLFLPGQDQAGWWLRWCGGVLIINCIPALALSTRGSTGPAPGQGARRLQIIIRAVDSLSEKQGYIICSTYSFLQPYILLFS